MTQQNHVGRGHEFWNGLGSPRTVRIIFLGMIVYFLVLGGLVLGYANVQNCLSAYNNDAARNTKTRAQLSADDRKLNVRIENVNTQDRGRILADQQALQDLVEAAIRADPAETAKALRDYKKVNEQSLSIFQTNEAERAAIALKRTRIDNARAAATPPDAPGERC